MMQRLLAGKTLDYLLATTTTIGGLQLFLIEESTLLSRVGSGLVLGFGTAAIAGVWLAGRGYAKLRRAVAVLFLVCGAGSLAIMMCELSESTISLISRF